MSALIASHWWVASRVRRANEPRLRFMTVTVLFTVWMAIPIWQGIIRGEATSMSEILFLAGLAPAAWLVFYAVLLIRR